MVGIASSRMMVVPVFEEDWEARQSFNQSCHHDNDSMERWI